MSHTYLYIVKELHHLRVFVLFSWLLHEILLHLDTYLDYLHYVQFIQDILTITSMYYLFLLIKHIQGISFQ